MFSSEGIKYIPLRTPGGELIIESGLFLRTKMEAEEGGSWCAREPSEREGGEERGVARQRRNQYEISRDEGGKNMVRREKYHIAGNFRG